MMYFGKHSKLPRRRPVRALVVTALASLFVTVVGQVPAQPAGADELVQTGGTTPEVPNWTEWVEDVYALAAGSETTLVDFADAMVADPDPEQQRAIDALKDALAEHGVSGNGVFLYHLLTEEGPTDIAVTHPSHFIVRDADTSEAEETVYRIVPLAAAVPTMPTNIGIVGNAVDSGTALDPGETDLVAAHNSADGNDERAHAEWKKSTADCYNIVTKAYARMICWQGDWQSGTSNPEKDHWQFGLAGSGYSRGSREMERLWVEAKPYPNTAQQEFDQIPVPGTAVQVTDQCNVVDQLKLESGEAIKVGFSRSWERVTCENYFPKVYSDEAHWAVVWDGDNLDDSQMRQVKFIMGTMTAASDCCPVWQLLTGQETSR